MQSAFATNLPGVKMSEDNKPNDDLRMSEAEWKTKRQGELRNQEFDKLIQKIIDLESDNRKLRDKATPDGAVVLSKTDAVRWSEYTKFGKPEEISSMLEAAHGANEELKNLKRKSTMREIAELHNMKFGVFEKLGASLAFDIVDTDGKRMAYVLDGDQKIPVEDYINSEWQDFMPSLVNKKQDDNVDKNVARPTFPSQKPLGESPKVSFEYIMQKKLESGDYNP